MLVVLETGSTGRRESVTTTKIGDFGVILGGHFSAFLRCKVILGGRVRVISGYSGSAMRVSRRF